jgi:hypothetical protein
VYILLPDLLGEAQSTFTSALHGLDRFLMTGLFNDAFN